MSRARAAAVASVSGRVVRWRVPGSPSRVSGSVSIDQLTNAGRVAPRAARRLWLLAASALYLVPASMVATVRPLWHDEIFTLYLSRLPSFHQLWSALAAGTDLLPPLSYVITRACLAAFGQSPVVLRLPEILGSWVMGLCLFRFVERRASTAEAGLAMLFPLSTLASLYTYEARPTAIVGAFAALALVSWQAATDGRRRGPALLVLAFSVAAAVATHYYALFLLGPFLVAEVVRAMVNAQAAERTTERERSGRASRGAGAPGDKIFDYPVLAALACAVLPLAILRPQIASGIAYSSAFWAKPVLGTIVEFYQIVFTPTGGVLAALLVLGAIARVSRRPETPADLEEAYPRHEVAALVTLTAMPIVAILLAIVTLPVFSPRYALWCVLGAAVLFSWLARTWFARSSLPAIVLAVVVAGGLLRGDYRALNEARAEDRDLDALATFLTTNAAPGPIVVAQPAEFLELGQRAPADLARRLLYLTDSAASIRQTGQDTADRALSSLGTIAPVHVEPFEAYLQTHRTFQIYVRDGRGWWIMAELPSSSTTIRARQGPYLLWDVNLDRR
jgi:hypothetical protein